MERSAAEAQAPPTPPILRLTPAIRRRIYLYAGFLPTCTDYPDLPYVLDLHGDNDQSKLGFRGLLLSCRTIYAEASDLLYSANRFVVRYGNKRSLEPLRSLTPTSLSKLTFLKIVLNQASCHPRDAAESFGQCAETNGRNIVVVGIDGRERFAGSDIPLDGRHRSAEVLLTEWRATVDYFASHIAPENLELCLVCDVDDADHNIEVAKRAVLPLGLLPPLKDCHIRLCRAPSTRFQDIAQKAVLEARNVISQPPRMTLSERAEQMQPPPSVTNTSRLLALPREIRFRILEYTDLITPWKEVTWDRTFDYADINMSQRHHVPQVKQYRGYRASRAPCYPLDFRGEKCLVHHGCQFTRCWETYPEPSVGCFCRRNHSAFSSACKCWAPPQALFLVCRTLTEDARVIFYSGNRFIIHDFESDPPYAAPLGPYPFERLAASIFLKEVVPTGHLRQLRFLELVFPPYSHEGWPSKDHPALKDWAKTIAWATNKLNAPGLTLRLVMNDVIDGGSREDRLFMTRQQGREILSAYTRILDPLAHLSSDGLARFYADFAWPWLWSIHWSGRTQELRSKKGDIKRRVERLVMGNRYEQLYSGGAVEPADSLWVRRYLRDG